MKLKLITLYLSLTVFVQPVLVFAQAPQTSSDKAWEPIKQLPFGEELIVELKNGTIVRGTILSTSDADLSLSLTTQQISPITRGEIRKAWRVLPPDPEKQRLFAGIGAGLGLFTALAIITSQVDRPCGNCQGTNVGVVAAIAGLPVGGALIGRKLGSRGKRILIYQGP